MSYEGYTPGYQSQQISPYGPPPSFPNQMFGMPDPSQAFFQDMRARNAQYSPSQGFAAPGGFDFQRYGVMGSLMNMALKSTLGGSAIPPFNGYDGGDLDYLNSLSRQGAATDHYKTLVAKGGAFEKDLIGKDPLFQMLQEMSGMTYGGSALRATNMVAGRMGSTFGGSVADQYAASATLIDQMRGQFASGKDGPHSYVKSFGFDLEESADNLDSGLRYGGVQGGKAGFRDAVSSGKGGSMVAAQNEKIRMGKQTFGSDMNADQINKLLSDAMGGIEQVSPEKATEFLAKVQSTSRALGINAKAFAEYVAMQQGVYKQMGLGGVVSGESIMRAAMTGESASQQAQSQGGGILANRGVAVAAASRNIAKNQGSRLLNAGRAVGAIYENLSPAQRAAITVGGVSVHAKMMEMQELINNGETTKAFAVIDQISKSGNGEFRQTYGLASRMTPEIAAAADKHLTFDGRADATSARKSFVRQLTGGIVKAEDKDAIEKAGGLSKLLAGVSEFSGENIKKALMDSGKVDEQTADRVSSKMAIDSFTIQSRKGGPDQQADFRERLYASSTQGIKDREANNRKITRDADKALILNRRMGALGRSLGVKDLGKFVSDFVKGGGVTTDTAAVKKALEASGIVANAEELKKQMDAVNGGDLDAVSDKAQQAYKDNLKNGKSAAIAARDAVLAGASTLTKDEQDLIDKKSNEAKEKIKASEANGMVTTEGLLEQAVAVLNLILNFITNGKQGTKPKANAETPGTNSTQVPSHTNS